MGLIAHIKNSWTRHQYNRLSESSLELKAPQKRRHKKGGRTSQYFQQKKQLSQQKKEYKSWKDKSHGYFKQKAETNVDFSVFKDINKLVSKLNPILATEWNPRMIQLLQNYESGQWDTFHQTLREFIVDFEKFSDDLLNNGPQFDKYTNRLLSIRYRLIDLGHNTFDGSISDTEDQKWVTQLYDSYIRSSVQIGHYKIKDDRLNQFTSREKDTILNSSIEPPLPMTKEGKTVDEDGFLNHPLRKEEKTAKQTWYGLYSGTKCFEYNLGIPVSGISQALKNTSGETFGKVLGFGPAALGLVADFGQAKMAYHLYKEYKILRNQSEIAFYNGNYNEAEKLMEKAQGKLSGARLTGGRSVLNTAADGLNIAGRFGHTLARAPWGEALGIAGAGVSIVAEVAGIYASAKDIHGDVKAIQGLRAQKTTIKQFVAPTGRTEKVRKALLKDTKSQIRAKKEDAVANAAFYIPARAGLIAANATLISIAAATGVFFLTLGALVSNPAGWAALGLIGVSALLYGAGYLMRRRHKRKMVKLFNKLKKKYDDESKKYNPTTKIKYRRDIPRLVNDIIFDFQNTQHADTLNWYKSLFPCLKPEKVDWDDPKSRMLKQQQIDELYVAVGKLVMA